MVKFDRASLLLALCVTVIISPWMPLSQCVEHSPDRAPFVTWAECAEWAKQLHRQVKAERAEIFSKKIWKNQITKIAENICNPKQERVEQDSERSCCLKCDSCRQVLLPSDNTDDVRHLYEKEADIHSFRKHICKHVETPSPKEDHSKQRFKKGAVDAGRKLKNEVCRIKHWFRRTSSKSNKHEL